MRRASGLMVPRRDSGMARHPRPSSAATAFSHRRTAGDCHASRPVETPRRSRAFRHRGWRRPGLGRHQPVNGAASSSIGQGGRDWDSSLNGSGLRRHRRSRNTLPAQRRRQRDLPCKFGGIGRAFAPQRHLALWSGFRPGRQSLRLAYEGGRWNSSPAQRQLGSPGLLSSVRRRFRVRVGPLPDL